MRSADGGLTPERPGMLRVVVATRVAHGLISILFLGCIATIYLGAWRGHADSLTLAAVAALALECVLVLASGGNCPLGPALRKVGDDTPFFELFLSRRAARLAVPTLGAVAVIGAALLALRTL
jgi:hypothetical protein